ncbi:hypothetical protein C8R45DRAFT_939468 [Mycena sanguinolenta]|nr:hypothetical protein C8R45DRAFT_939468 [Mycena sanguinolenta]
MLELWYFESDKNGPIEDVHCATRPSHFADELVRLGSTSYISQRQTVTTKSRDASTHRPMDFTDDGHEACPFPWPVLSVLTFASASLLTVASTANVLLRLRLVRVSSWAAREVLMRPKARMASEKARDEDKGSEFTSERTATPGNQWLHITPLRGHDLHRHPFAKFGGIRKVSRGPSHRGISTKTPAFSIFAIEDFRRFRAATMNPWQTKSDTQEGMIGRQSLKDLDRSLVHGYIVESGVAFSDKMGADDRSLTDKQLFNFLAKLRLTILTIPTDFLGERACPTVNLSRQVFTYQPPFLSGWDATGISKKGILPFPRS